VKKEHRCARRADPSTPLSLLQLRTDRCLERPRRLDSISPARLDCSSACFPECSASALSPISWPGLASALDTTSFPSASVRSTCILSPFRANRHPSPHRRRRSLARIQHHRLRINRRPARCRSPAARLPTPFQTRTPGPACARLVGFIVPLESHLPVPTIPARCDSSPRPETVRHRVHPRPARNTALCPPTSAARGCTTSPKFRLHTSSTRPGRRSYPGNRRIVPSPRNISPTASTNIQPTPPPAGTTNAKASRQNSRRPRDANEEWCVVRALK
jgi:hypothetical protein